jgi:hypothetical protein
MSDASAQVQGAICDAIVSEVMHKSRFMGIPQAERMESEGRQVLVPGTVPVVVPVGHLVAHAGYNKGTVGATVSCDDM